MRAFIRGGLERTREISCWCLLEIGRTLCKLPLSGEADAGSGGDQPASNWMGQR
jgi:hypothetical protein